MIATLAATVAIGALSFGTARADETQTIAEIATGNPDFSTLVAALTAADLVGPFDSCDDAKTTVFAPTNDAFAAALSSLGMTADQLLADKDLLTSVLTYHVVAGEVDAATVVTLDKATTLNGKDIKIAVVDGSVVLNDTVKVTATDIKACNGIIHVIDGVLLPPADTPTEMPATGSGSTTIAMLGGGLLMLGAGALVIGRRRPATVTA
ncbi:MAG: fasciclin domain-containing protein [Ilumatobacteraceae bacterium]